MTGRTWRAVTGALVAGTLLAGCGNDTAAQKVAAPPTPTPVVSSATPTTTSPAPSPAPLSLAEAQARYLNLVAPVNDATRKLNALIDAQASFAKVKSAQAAYAAAVHSCAAAMVATAWPPSAQPAVDALVVEMTKEVTLAQTLADAKTVAEYNAQDTGPQAQKTAAAAEMVRLKLGLPAAK